MRFNPLILLAGFICFISSFNGRASEIYSDDVMAFEIKPNVCIVKKIGQACELTFTVQWRTVKPMNLCLVERQTILQCWREQQYVDESTEVLLHQTTSVDLVDEKRQVLAQEDLQVNAAQPKKRRRLRSAWSLF